MAPLPEDNSILCQTVRRAARQGRLSHAVILSGQGDLTGGARFLAAAYVCQEQDRPCLRCRHCRKALEGIHPDVLTVEDTERRELAVDDVRALRQEVYIRPNEAERKVFVFSDCRQLSVKDQNVLLKVLEDGPLYAAFVFCTDSPAALLETVRSRCTLLHSGGEAEASLSPRTAELCRALSRGRLLPVTEALVSLENSKLKREELRTLLRELWRVTAEALLLRRGKTGDTLPEARLLADSLTDRQLMGLCEASRSYAAECDYNVGVGHVLGGLAVKWEELL